MLPGQRVRRLIRPARTFALILMGLTLTLQPSTCAAEGSDASAPIASPGWWQQIQTTASLTMESNKYELYLPLHTWHNRSMYTSEKISSFNEDPWGIGGGKYRFDDQGNWHAWYAMAFLDSHNAIEPMVGYAYEKIWRPAADWRLGLGFTAGFTSRQDYLFIPLPLVLPLASIGYRRLTLQATYIPGSKGAGNILFTWMRWQF